MHVFFANALPYLYVCDDELRWVAYTFFAPARNRSCLLPRKRNFLEDFVLAIEHAYAFGYDEKDVELEPMIDNGLALPNLQTHQ